MAQNMDVLEAWSNFFHKNKGAKRLGDNFRLFDMDFPNLCVET